MISILSAFWMFVLLFGLIGAMRGCLVPGAAFQSLPDPIQSQLKVQFWSRAAIVAILAFFGYQTPRLAVLKDKARREKIQDVLLGAVLGLGSGFFIVGTLWFYMEAAHYPFSPNIMPPQPGTPLGDAALNAIKYFPPVFASNQIGLFFSVVVAFMFVLVVFI